MNVNTNRGMYLKRYDNFCIMDNGSMAFQFGMSLEEYNIRRN